MRSNWCGDCQSSFYLPGESRFPMVLDHINMVKFDSAQNRVFQTIVRCMKGWCVIGAMYNYNRTLRL